MQISEGNKQDQGKADWTLLPINSVTTVIKVLEFGMSKYGRDNWKLVKEPKRRYLSAAYRHLGSIVEGDWNDPETNLPHAAHAICCLLFVLWFGDGSDPT